MQSITNLVRGNSRKVLGMFSLAMINVIAVDSLRTLPAGAFYGFSLVFFYLIAALVFFVPTALITAELATTWPNTGGVYIWVRTAFGRPMGLLVIWLQWIYNVVWYPTILSFIAATFAYLINPSLANNKIYILSMVIGVWWLATAVNCIGLKASNRISMVGAILGTLIPMIFISLLSVIWLKTGNPSQINFTLNAFMPDLTNFNQLSFLTTVIFGLMGLEMSAVHAGDVKNPQRDYPRALILSVILIVATLICASLAIAIVLPHQQLSVLSGLIDAYTSFFASYKLTAWVPLIITFIVLGSFAGMSAWVIGPTRGLLIAMQENEIGNYWQRLNSKGMPIALLLLQGFVVTFLCIIFVLMPTINAAYWVLSVMTSQLALLFYLFFFVTAIRLRYKKTDRTGAYCIPGGKFGIWLVAGVGILSCIFVFVLGFVPPAGVQIGSLMRFEAILVLGISMFCILPLMYIARSSRLQTLKLS